MHLRLFGRRVRDPFSLIEGLLVLVKLAGYESLRIARYSRGMVQRLGIAQTLMAIRNCWSSTGHFRPRPRLPASRLGLLKASSQCQALTLLTVRQSLLPFCSTNRRIG